MSLPIPIGLEIPDKIMQGMLSNDPSLREEAVRLRDSFITKYNRTGLVKHKCVNCGVLPIYHFHVSKIAGKWYVYSKCGKCTYKDLPESKKKKKRVYPKEKASARSAKRVKLMTKSYVMCLLKSEGYKEEDITEKLIEDKRDKVKAFRINRKNKTPKERKKESDSASIKKAISNLTDTYIISRIKCSAGYKGEKITEKMIQDKRESILAYRNKIANKLLNNSENGS